MEIIQEGKKVNVNGKPMFFSDNVDTVLTFPECCIVLLMNDDIPDNNVEAVDYNGNKVWNISQIIEFEYPEAYISLSKESETTFSVVSYNGVKFVVDVTTKHVVNKSITK